MITSSLQLLVVVLAFVVGRAGAAYAQAPPTLSIRGTVLDLNGTPYGGGCGRAILVPQNVWFTVNQTHPVPNVIPILNLDSPLPVTSLNQFLGMANTWTGPQTFNAAVNLGSGGSLAGTFSGNPTFSGTANVKNMESIRFADQFSAAEIGAQFNAAVAGCPTNCTIRIPAGSYSFSTTMNFANGVTLECAGPAATTLAYTGSGTAVNMNIVTRAAFRNCGLSISNANAIGIQVSGVDNRVEDFYLTGTSAKLLNVTGYGGNTQSLSTQINRGRIDSFDAVGLQVDHAIDTYLTDVAIYAATNSVTAQPFVIDTGTSGLYVKGVPTGYGLHGLLVKNSRGGAGAYNASPRYLFFDQLLADTCTGGDCWFFDSTLSTEVVSAHFTNSWAAYAGHNNAGATVTARSNGIHISGGHGIYIGGGTRVRLNAGNGVLIDNANVQDVTMDGDYITANNTDNAADQHGVYVTQAAADVSVLNSRIGNVLDAGGNQRYAVKIAAVNADQFRLENNDLNSNVTGPLSNSSTGNYWIFGNLPSSSPTSNVVWGDILMGSGNVVLQGTGQLRTPTMYVSAATPTVAAGQVGFGNSTGFGKGSSGTSVTTTAKGTGTGPATPQTIVNYIKINIGGTDYWIPLVQ